MQSNRRLYWWCGFFLLFTALVYGSALQGPLFFDDGPNLTSNDFVKITGTRFDDWRAAALSSDAGITRRPLSMLTFAVNYALAGEFFPAHLKAVNLLIHLLIGLLVYGLSRALLCSPVLADKPLGDRRLLGLLAAGIWFLHPLHVSTVLYAVQRMAQLSTLFMVAGLLVYCSYRLRWVERGAEVGEIVAAALWLSLLMLLAVFSKENGALLPWLIAVVEISLFRGMWHQRQRPALVAAGWLVFFLPLLCLVLFLLTSPELVTGRYGGREFTVEERLFTQGRVLWHYVSWLIVPDINAMGFQHDDIALSRGLFDPHTTWVALLAWVLLLLGSWRLRRVVPLLIFAVLFYLVAHFMESGIYPLEMVYEHRNYLPAVGVAVFVAGVVGQVVHAMPHMRLGVAVVGILTILAALLAVRTHTWSDEVILSRVNLENHPGSPRSHFFYGNALFKRYQQRQDLQLTEAQERDLAVGARYHFERMHELNPRDLAPIVMLYQIDSGLFAAMPDRVDWLEKLEVLLRTRRLQASDHAALSGLLNHFSHIGPGDDRTRFAAMLDKLVDRYPSSSAVALHKYKLLATDSTVGPEVRLDLLRRAQGLKPGDLSIYPYQMIEYENMGDRAPIYELSREWIRYDKLRWQLPAIRHVFSNQ